MVVAAHPLATAAGIGILDQGGSAVDATIAAQLVLGLVEPQSSGLGGGAFALVRSAADGRLSTYDGRETAPAAATADRFLRDGRPMAFDAAVRSGLSVGTPGVVRLLEHMHAKHGKLAWATLFQPAITLAENGFEVTPRLHALLRGEGAATFDEEARKLYFPEGQPAAVGFRLRNPAYAETLRKLADGGAAAFYRTALADTIVQAVAAQPDAGDLTLADLEAYRIIEREPLCVAYRRHRVCGMGPPSSGGLAVAQALKLVEPFDLGRSPLNPRALHLLAEAMKLAFADRDRYVGDPAFAPLVGGLLESGYLESRRRLIDPARAMPRPQAGVPPSRSGAHLPGNDTTTELAGTSHVSVVDAAGNAVAMTTTIESAFGSRRMAGGFLLNNQLTDFAFRSADTGGRLLANRIEPGKRPRSSMAPTVILDEAGHLKAVLGSPGGARIIPYVIKAVVAVLDWDLDPQSAVALANFASRGGPLEIETAAGNGLSELPVPWRRDVSPAWHALQMAAFGHAIAPDAMTSGTHMIVVGPAGLEGGADPRREGVADGR